MEVIRIDAYDDPRFSQQVLRQHGAFLADGVPFPVEIVSPDTALVPCTHQDVLDAVIAEFRFYAGHISRFVDAAGTLLREFPPVNRFSVALADIQPSQFYADMDKLSAVCSFIAGPEDVIIPLVRFQERFISLDGHTRMAAACRMGFTHVTGYLDDGDEWVYRFAQEAARRGVTSPHDIEIISHEEYCVKWHRFCDVFFAGDGD